MTPGATAVDRRPAGGSAVDDASASGTAGALRDALRRDGCWLLAIVAVGVVLRVAWALYAARPPQGLHDPAFYTLYAEQIAGGHGYRLPDGSPTAYYPVGYPAALGAVLWLVRATPLPDATVGVAAAFNIVLAAVTLVLVWDLGRRLADRRVGLVAAAGAAVYPNLVLHTGVALTETLFNTLAVAAAVVVVAGPWERPRAGRLAIFGLLVGLGVMVRPPGALLLVALVVAGWWGARWGLRRVALAAVVPGVAVVLVAVPWMVRNAEVMGEPVLSTNTGDNLCIGHNPDATGAFAMTPACIEGYDHLQRPEYELARDEGGREVALGYLREEPQAQIRLVALRFWHTFRDDSDAVAAAESYGADPFLPDGVRPALTGVANAAYVMVLALALVGAPRLVRRGGPARLFTVLAACSLVVPPLLTFGDPRFKVPMVPFLLVFAAVTLVDVADRSRERRRPTPAAAPAH